MFNHHYCCVFSGWRARLFLNYYYYHELRCFSGGVRGYFLINTITVSFVFLGGVRGYFKIIITIIVSFVFRVACAVIFNYCDYCGFCSGFSGGVRSYLELILLLRVVFSGWCARLYLIITIITNVVVFVGGVRG